VPLIKGSPCVHFHVNGLHIWPSSVHSAAFICIAKSTKIAALARTSSHFFSPIEQWIVRLVRANTYVFNSFYDFGETN
jgi:hypothetical protein